jgi:4'-phosphopantetheinyl transferase
MTTGASVSDLIRSGKQIGPADGTLRAVATATGDIEVWESQLDLDDSVVNHCMTLLSPDELSRAERLRHATDRRRFVVARSQLRRLLSHRLEVSPQSIVFGYTRSKKPILDTPAAAVYFNVSHSEDRALFAVSERCQPGIDLEYLKRAIEPENLAQRFFTPAEHALLMRFPAAERKREFLVAWTRKEAVVKALGDGLWLPLDRFEISIGEHQAPRVVTSQDSRALYCTLETLNVDSDFFASLAVYRKEDAGKNSCLG